MTEIRRPLSLQLNPTVKGPVTTATSRTIGPPSRPRTLPTMGATNKRAALGPLRNLKTSASSSSLTSISSSSASTTLSSPTSSSFSPRTPHTQTSCHESPDSPSLILPYLYVGDQAQTQIDTISNLNISYILSLQSLPKFLDSDIQLEEAYNKEDIDSINSQITTLRQESTTDNVDSCDHAEASTPSTKSLLNLDKKYIQSHTYQDAKAQSSSPIDTKNDQSPGTSKDERKDTRHTVARELLPSLNSSKDYLVKFRSCVNRLIKGKCINISDTFEQYVEKFFDETHNFIEEARRNKCNILVHCKAGISRSPTIAIAYLMKWKQLHLQDAYDFVKKCRPQISPNLNFIGQLMNYERSLLQQGFHNTKLPSPTTNYLLTRHCHINQIILPQNPSQQQCPSNNDSISAPNSDEFKNMDEISAYAMKSYQKVRKSSNSRCVT